MSGNKKVLNRRQLMLALLIAAASRVSARNGTTSTENFTFTTFPRNSTRSNSVFAKNVQKASDISTTMPHVTEYKPPDLTMTKPFNMTFLMKMVDLEWDPKLNDSSTTEFKNLAAEVETVVDEAFRGCPGIHEDSSKVMYFTPGSVITNYAVFFSSKAVYEDSNATVEFITTEADNRLSSSIIFESKIDTINMTEQVEQQVESFLFDPCPTMTDAICPDCYYCGLNPSVECIPKCDLEHYQCGLVDNSNPEETVTECNCLDGYVMTGGSCVSQELIIYLTAVIVSTIIFIQICIIIVLHYKLHQAEKGDPKGEPAEEDVNIEVEGKFKKKTLLVQGKSTETDSPANENPTCSDQLSGSAHTLFQDNVETNNGFESEV